MIICSNNWKESFILYWFQIYLNVYKHIEKSLSKNGLPVSGSYNTIIFENVGNPNTDYKRKRCHNSSYQCCIYRNIGLPIGFLIWRDIPRYQTGSIAVLLFLDQVLVQGKISTDSAYNNNQMIDIVNNHNHWKSIGGGSWTFSYYSRQVISYNQPTITKDKCIVEGQAHRSNHQDLCGIKDFIVLCGISHKVPAKQRVM